VRLLQGVFSLPAIIYYLLDNNCLKIDFYFVFTVYKYNLTKMNFLPYLSITSRMNILCFLGKEYYQTNPDEFHIRFNKKELEKSHEKVYNLYKNTVIHRNQDDEKDSFYYCVNRFIYADMPHFTYPYNKKYTIVCLSTNQQMSASTSNTMIYVTYPNRVEIKENFIYPRY
jgi:hypothetical protein